MINRILLAVLSLLGFATACEDKDEPAMYGTPRADYRVQGKVTDTAGAPIPNIKVSDRYDYGDQHAIRTASDGTYDISGQDFPRQASLLFTDDDGPEHGGEFTEKAFEVKFTEEDRVGKGNGWYSGSFARENVDVVLDEVPAEAPEDKE